MWIMIHFIPKSWWDFIVVLNIQFSYSIDVDNLAVIYRKL